MSTRSNIGIINLNGSVEMVYCHSDGYSSHNGALLLDHYTDKVPKLRQLLTLGDMSSLDKEIGEKHGFDFNDRPIDECTFYARDRGETGVGSRKFKNVKLALKAMEEFLYLWDCKTNSWIFSDHGAEFKPLTMAGCRED